MWAQVRAVARKAAALRAAERQLAAAEAAKVAKEEQVVQAKEAQVGLAMDRCHKRGMLAPLSEATTVRLQGPCCVNPHPALSFWSTA